MPTLQIRNVPEDVYQALAFRAERAQRSLAQQALVELRGAAGGPAGGRRKPLPGAIKRSLPASPVAPSPRPEELLRSDRER